MVEELNFNNERNGDNKNIKTIMCQHCNSIILKPLSNNDYIEKEFQLPLPHQKNQVQASEVETQTLKHFWVIDDMFTFENIGFSNTVDNYKYLICADCDMGPVGYHNIETKKCYIALERVKHD